MKQIREMLKQLHREQKRAVIATIIHVEGSAYQREGSRCLFLESGEIIGMLSGGCVEEDVQVHAAELFTHNKPKQISYDFRTEADDIWGMGVGCDGAITIWLECFDPINEADKALSILNEFQSRLFSESMFISSFVIKSQNQELYPLGFRVICSESIASLISGNNNAGLVDCHINGVNLTLFVEQVFPAPVLTIVGSGPDAALLCRMADSLDWRVRIVAHKALLAENNTFSEAEEWIQIARGEFSQVHIDKQQYVVLMTHQLELDVEAVKQWLPNKHISYLGILGSKRRVKTILDCYKAALGEEKDHALLLQKLHAPVGLNIGAKTPEEITLSIMSELIAVRNHLSHEVFPVVMPNA